MISALFRLQLGIRLTQGRRAVSRLGLAVLLTGVVSLAGCMQTTLSPSTDASMTQRDRQLLAHPPYAQASIPEQYQRQIVDY